MVLSVNELRLFVDAFPQSEVLLILLIILRFFFFFFFAILTQQRF